MKLNIKNNSRIKDKFNLIFLLYLILGIIGFVGLVFFINQQQMKIQLYAIGAMGANQDIFIAVPYWVANGINKGDKDKSIIGNANVEILDKLAYEGGSHGKHVILDMKLNALKDKNGKYFYRNQPIEVNKWFDLRLGKVNEKVFLLYLDSKPQKKEKKKLKVVVKKAQELPYITDNLFIGDEMLNDKGESMAKIIDKTDKVAEIKSYTPSGELYFRRDPTTKDLTLTLELSVLNHDGLNYFGEIRKVKIGEKINLFFRNATLWDGIIISVSEI